uniref:Uncharacterized protein n=2 Tax=Denticeps clupeoides TaxID=299321 RepID=A0AAY4E741_9TELE
HESARILRTQQHRLRFSDAVEPNSFVFPLSGTAFLMVDSEEFTEETFGKIQRFVQVHRNSFLLLQAPVYGTREWGIISSVQDRFFGSNLRILPVHNNVDMVNGIVTVAKATSKPHGDVVRERVALARAHIVEHSAVWEMLRDVQLFSAKAYSRTGPPPSVHGEILDVGWRGPSSNACSVEFDSE